MEAYIISPVEEFQKITDFSSYVLERLSAGFFEQGYSVAVPTIRQKDIRKPS